MSGQEVREGAVVTFPHHRPRTLTPCRSVGIVRWINKRTQTVTVRSAEDGRVYCLSIAADIREIPAGSLP